MVAEPRSLHVRPKRVVVVDDSRTMRQWLAHVLGSDPRLEVVGLAADAQEARQMIKAHQPDVVTLDIEMPGMSGLEFLEKLMALNPLPVVMVAAETGRGSSAAIRALSLGAVDCVLKPGNALDRRAQRALVRHVYTAACSHPRPKPVLDPAGRPAGGTTHPRAMPLILIGASTGGVGALETVLENLDPGGPPVVIVQHMPGPFLISFCQMLNRTLPQEVGFLRHDAPMAAGQVLLVPEVGKQPQITRIRDQWVGRLVAPAQDTVHCPSVDALFASVVEYASDICAVLLTGLGRDGATGMKHLRDAGAATFAQDERTSVVYGMPRAAFEIGAVSQQLPVERMGGAINCVVQAKYAQPRSGEA